MKLEEKKLLLEELWKYWSQTEDSLGKVLYYFARKCKVSVPFFLEDSKLLEELQRKDISEEAPQELPKRRGRPPKNG